MPWYFTMVGSPPSPRVRHLVFGRSGLETCSHPFFLQFAGGITNGVHSRQHNSQALPPLSTATVGFCRFVNYARAIRGSRRPRLIFRETQITETDRWCTWPDRSLT